MDIKCLRCGIKVCNVTKRRKFCSQKCADAYRYVPKPKRGKWIKCAYCGKKVWTPPWRFKFKYRFCNQEHQILFSKRKAFHKNCVICGKTFFCQPFQVKHRNRKTCSKICGGKLQSANAKKKRIKSGFTKHQIDRCVRYSTEADNWRKAVFERDGYRCRKCGEKGGYLEAHHIKPFAYFPELRFELSNGLTLCEKCHNKTKLSAKEMKKLYA